MESLVGQFVIAMPGMGDPNFNESVTFICKHDDEGALGIIVNRQSNMQVGEIFNQLDLDVRSPSSAEQWVMNGGPMQPERGFVLHQSDREFDSTMDPDADVKVTVSQDILKVMAQGEGPERTLVALGYAGWSSGQLESELAANAWLSVAADPEIIFSTPVEQRWQAAAGLLGVDIRQVTNYAGHA